jgi:hypothetical protein
MNMIARLTATAVFLVPALTQAVPYEYPYNMMTAEEVVKKLLVKPANDADYAERDSAYAYVAGIKDGTQGTVWCFQPGLKPDELIYETVHAIRRNNTPDALKVNAAVLILKELRRQYPCPAAKGRARP